MDSIRFIPLSFQDACTYSNENHLYLDKCPHGHLFSIGATYDYRIRGVIIWGRPTNKYLQDGYTIQGYRLATDHTVKNIGSILISRSLKVCRLLGYRQAITYVRIDYAGVQVRACGFVLMKAGTRARNGDLLDVYSYDLTTR